ncbi:MAG TPA: transcriptional repressor [Anaerolineae bacterium]|nr:transcriptional repressor [Anaerolineae bacterium]
MVKSRQRLDALVGRLREKGHRLTPQRMAVLKVLIGSHEHPSAEQIHARVKAELPMTSLATTYKTLAVLKQMEEVLEINLGNDGSRYDAGNPTPHPHVVCLECGSIMDVDVGDLSDLPREVARRTGYQIVSHRLDFFGVCPRCQEKEQLGWLSEGGETGPAPCTSSAAG